MATLFGRDHTRTELLRRVGNMAQVAGIREYTYNSGRADGVKAVEVNTGRLRFELLPSRCLDISLASYNGVPFGYHSKSGVRHPAYYDRNNPAGFHGQFLGGVLTTCGFFNIGPPGESGGVMHPLHGDVHSMPAEKVSIGEEWRGDDCVFNVSGEVHHSAFYHEDLVLRRHISAKLGGNSLSIVDEVENLDFAPTPCLLLYHMQFGYPFLDGKTRLITSPIAQSVVRPGNPPGELKRFATFGEPRDGAEEVCFFHTFKPVDGWAAACLFNPELGENGMGVYVRFHSRTLPHFIQWKMLRSREYVCGLEPASAPLVDRTADDLKANTLEPQASRIYMLEVGVLEGEKACKEMAKQGGLS